MGSVSWTAGSRCKGKRNRPSPAKRWTAPHHHHRVSNGCSGYPPFYRRAVRDQLSLGGVADGETLVSELDRLQGLFSEVVDGLFSTPEGLSNSAALYFVVTPQLGQVISRLFFSRLTVYSTSWPHWRHVSVSV